MPKYDIYIVCDKCGHPHSVNVKIELDDGLDRTLLSDHYGDLPLPAEIAFMQTNKYRCPHTNKLFLANNIDRAILFACV